jgi:hypothetical protein
MRLTILLCSAVIAHPFAQQDHSVKTVVHSDTAFSVRLTASPLADSTVYKGPLYMGSGLEELSDVVWDTGSAWVALETTDCTDCTETLYDYSTSSTYTQTDDTFEYLSYI